MLASVLAVRLADKPSPGVGQGFQRGRPQEPPQQLRRSWHLGPMVTTNLLLAAAEVASAAVAAAAAAVAAAEAAEATAGAAALAATGTRVATAPAAALAALAEAASAAVALAAAVLAGVTVALAKVAAAMGKRAAEAFPGARSEEQKGKIVGLSTAWLRWASRGIGAASTPRQKGERQAVLIF